MVTSRRALSARAVPEQGYIKSLYELGKACDLSWKNISSLFSPSSRLLSAPSVSWERSLPAPASAGFGRRLPDHRALALQKGERKWGSPAFLGFHEEPILDRFPWHIDSCRIHDTHMFVSQKGSAIFKCRPSTTLPASALRFWVPRPETCWGSGGQPAREPGRPPGGHGVQHRLSDRKTACSCRPCPGSTLFVGLTVVSVPAPCFLLSSEDSDTEAF